MMDQLPYSYTNRQGKTWYFRAVTTKKGGCRYYLTRDPQAEDLITEVPPGFEVVEYPYDARVVLRKRVPVWTRPEELAAVRAAMERVSPVRDFIITAERGGIAISISQFNNFHDGTYCTPAEARELYGPEVDRWKVYHWIMTFELLNKRTRRFQVIRRAYAFEDAVAIAEGNDLAALAETYCYHVGRASLLNFWPGEE